MAKILDKVKEVAQDAMEAIEDVAEKVVDKTEEIVEDVKETVAGKKNIKKEAEEESTTKAAELEAKKKALLEKVKALSSKVESEASTADLKELIKAKKRSEMLIPLDDYVKAGIYLGTRVVTPSMKQYVYRRRADGLAIFNTDTIDEKLKEGINYLCEFDAKDIILVCKRQAGWRAAEMFSKLTGIRVFTKKYPAGVLTNTNLKNFEENKLTIITDQWLDKNALKDTLDVKKKILMICDTNNFSKGANQVIIGNNKSPKSLGIIFYLMTKGFCKAKGIEIDMPDIDWWTSETDKQ